MSDVSQVFWVRRKDRMVGGPFWIVEARHEGRWAAVETFDAQEEAVTACAELNANVFEQRARIARQATAQVAPRPTLAQMRRRLEMELDAAGVTHERIAGRGSYGPHRGS